MASRHRFTWIPFSLALLLQACGGGHGSSSPPPPPAPAITDVNGGLTGSGTIGSLFIVDGTGFGDLGAATAGYSLDFRDATGTVVASATSTVNYAGGAWKSLYITAQVPLSGLTAGSSYQVTVTTPGGTSNAVTFLVLASQPYAPNITWTQGYGLPVAMAGFPTVTAAIGTPTPTTYIYVLGGNTAGATTAGGKSQNTAAVYLNALDSTTGAPTLATWTAAASLPAERGFSAAVVANGFNSKVGGNGKIYVLGGLDSTGAATATVYRASLNADGSIPAATAAGAWATTTALPQPLFAHGAAIFHGRIYVAGGNDATGAPVAKVYSASINSDGTLGAWTTLADLPEARAYHQFVTVAGFLYVIGGTTTSGVDPLSDVESAGSRPTVFYDAIDLVSGGLGATWTTATTQLSKGREKFTASVAGGGVLVSGGLYSGASTGSTEEEYAAVNSDGSLGTFTATTGAYTITKTAGGYNFYDHSAAYFADAAGKPHVLILGGEEVSLLTSNGLPHAEVWYQ